MNPLVQPQGFTPTVAQIWIGADTLWESRVPNALACGLLARG
jgi:hypothetical protein